jgi:molybdate transport system substrate-binding protein
MSSKIFNNLARGAGIVSAGVIFALAASPASAATCADVGSSGSPVAKVAVASNFFAPMIDLLGLYTAANSNKVTVCHDSTGVLDAAIRGGNPDNYSLFLAADTTRPHNLVGTSYVQTGAIDHLYAKGIPVLFALKTTFSSVSSLVSTQSGYAADINSSPPDALTPPTSPNKLAVADPDKAPYGDAAFKIMDSMGVLSSAYSNPKSPPIETWMHTPLYGNIDDTFQSVAGTSPVNQSGFVSKSQVCGGIYPTQNPPTYVYVSFSDSSFLLDQSGILIKSNNGTDTAGAAIFSYMLSLSGGSPPWATWNDFLTAHCYNPI